MSLQSFVPLQLHSAGEKIVPEPDSHLKAYDGAENAATTSMACDNVNSFRMMVSISGFD